MWSSYVRHQYRHRLFIMRMICWRSRRAMQEWKKISDIDQFRKHATVAKEICLMKVLRRWYKYIQLQKKIRIACFVNSDKYKGISLGFSFLSCTWKKYKKRGYFHYWYHENRIMNSIIWSIQWNESKCRKRYLSLWKFGTVQQREERLNNAYRTQVLECLQQMRDTKHETKSSFRSDSKVKHDNESTPNNHYNALLRREEYNKQINQIILNSQAERRRKRFQSEKMLRRQEWLEKWNNEEKRRIKKCHLNGKRWNKKSNKTLCSST